MEIRSHVLGQSLKLWVFSVGIDMRSQRGRHSITVGHVKGTGTSPRVEDEGNLWQQKEAGKSQENAGTRSVVPTANAHKTLMQHPQYPRKQG